MRPIFSLSTLLLVISILFGYSQLSYGQEDPLASKEIQSKMEALLIEGDLEQAIQLNNAYLDYFNQQGDTTLLALYLSNQGAILYYQGKYESAIQQWEAYLPLIDTIEKPIMRGRVLSNLCECHKQLFNYAQSYQYCRQAIAEMDKQGDHLGTISTLSMLVQHWLTMNQVDTAYSLARESLQLAILYQQPFAMAEAHQMLSSVAVRQNLPNEAIHHLEVATNLYDSLGFQHGLAGCQQELATIYLSLGKPYLAAEAAQKSLTIVRQLNTHDYNGRGLLQMAEAYLQLNLPEIAAVWLDSAKVVLEHLPNDNLYLARDYYKITKQWAWSVGDSLRGYEAYQQYIIMLDSIHHLEKNEALLSFQLAYNQEENENRIATLAGQVTRYSSSLILILIVLLMVIAVSLFLIIRYRSAINRLHSKSSLLEKEMGSMRAQQIIGLLPTEHPDENNQLCRYRLEAYLQSPLNDTDWNLLTTLTENPNLSNPQLARNLSLSYEGLRSALKKMYRLFQIDESVSNKRVALLAAIMTANNYNQVEEKR